MKILTWNCQGLGNSWTVQALHQMVKNEKPIVVFLSETRSDARTIDSVRRKIGFANGIGIGRQGAGDGVALLWAADCDIQVISFSSFHIDAYVGDASRGWRLTGIYDRPETENRHHTWALLRKLKDMSNKPWVVCGDFNEILHWTEKKKGRDAAVSRFVDFRQALQDCDLYDLGVRGYFYTWYRKFGGGYIEERLDRFVATGSWSNLFPNAVAHNITASVSDHSPITLTLNSQARRNRAQGKMFKFELMWTRHEGCREIIENSWDSPMSIAESENSCNVRRARCREALQLWNRDVFGHV